MNSKRIAIPMTTFLNVALFAVVVVLAGYLRFAQLDLAEFKLDEARALLMATRILEEDPFVTRGLSTSAGQENSPAILYLLVIPLVFSSEVVWATGFIALINTVAVAGYRGDDLARFAPSSRGAGPPDLVEHAQLVHPADPPLMAGIFNRAPVLRVH